MRAAALSRRFAALLVDDAHGGATAASLLGVEHEYHVVSDGARVDFRALIDGLDLGRLHLDPSDANARRLPSGAALTCDGTEAEVALPPIRVHPGFTREAEQRAAAERTELRRRLGVGFVLAGSSTHISVGIAAPLHVIDAVARRYARTFAAPLMLLIDRPDSYGIYVRPRPGRLELCGEYATGERLRAVLAFAVGSVRVAMAQLLGQPAGVASPPPVRVAVEACPDRYGYMIHRRSMGGDLYADGRDASLTLESGGSTLAQEHLEIAWTAAREALAADAGAGDIAVVDGAVNSAHPLPAPTGEPDDAESNRLAPDPVAFGRVAGSLRRPGFDMAAVMITWRAVVLVVERPDRRRRAFVCIPRASLERFVKVLDDGRLDGIIGAYLRGSHWGRWLERSAQLRQPGLYNQLGPRRALLPREMDRESTVTARAA